MFKEAWVLKRAEERVYFFLLFLFFSYFQLSFCSFNKSFLPQLSVGVQFLNNLWMSPQMVSGREQQRRGSGAIRAGESIVTHGCTYLTFQHTCLSLRSLWCVVALSEQKFSEWGKVVWIKEQSLCKGEKVRAAE